MCEFVCSDIVECIDDTPVRAESQAMPREGQLYTVARVRHVGGGYSVRLKELAPTCYLGGPCACGECGWDSARFRKVYRPNEARLRAMMSLVAIPA
jgi:hypothetical protein